MEHVCLVYSLLKINRISLFFILPNKKKTYINSICMYYQELTSWLGRQSSWIVLSLLKDFSQGKKIKIKQKIIIIKQKQKHFIIKVSGKQLGFFQRTWGKKMSFNIMLCFAIYGYVLQCGVFQYNFITGSKLYFHRKGLSLNF